MSKFYAPIRTPEVTDQVVDQAFGKYPYDPIVDADIIVSRDGDQPVYPVNSIEHITPTGEYYFPTTNGNSEQVPSYNISVRGDDRRWKMKNVVPFLCNMGEPATAHALYEWGGGRLVTTSDVTNITFAYSSKFHLGFLRPQPHVAMGAKTTARLFWINCSDIENRLSLASKGIKNPLTAITGPRADIKTEDGDKQIGRFVAETMDHGLFHYKNQGFISPFSSVNNQIISTPFNQVGHAEVLHWIRRHHSDYTSTEDFLVDAFYNPALSCGVNMTLRQYAAGKHSILQPDLPFHPDRGNNSPPRPQNIKVRDVFSV